MTTTFLRHLVLRFFGSAIALAFVPYAGAQPVPKAREVAATPGQINNLRLSADGSLLAAQAVRIKPDGKRTGDGNEVIVWEQASGKVRVNTGKTLLYPLGFTSDGKSVVLGGRTISGTVIQLWDVETGKSAPETVLSKDDAWPFLSADRSTVTTVTNHGAGHEVVAHKIENWDVLTGKSLDSFTLDAVKTLSPRQVAKGPFLSTILTPKGVGLLARDPKSGKATQTDLPGVTTARVSEDGKWVIGHAEKAIKLFDASGKPRWSQNGSYSGFTFGVAGKNVITTNRPAKVNLHDLATGKVTRTIDAGLESINDWAMSPDGKTLYVTGAKDKTYEENVIRAFTLGAK